MTTAAVVIGKARRLLHGAVRDPLVTLTAAADSDDTIWSLSSTTGIIAGALLEAGIEVVQVTATTASTVTVVRAQYGTDAGSHASGATVRVNATLFDSDLFDALNATLRSLSAPSTGLYRVATADVTTTGESSYDLTVLDDMLGVLDVRLEEYADEWPRLVGWELIRQPTAPQLRFPGGVASSRTVRLWYAARFGQVTALSDDVETVTGLPSNAIDLAWLGAAIRAIPGREVRRNLHETAGSPRRSDEVPAGANLQAPAAVVNQFIARTREEAAALRKQYPSLRWRA